MLDLKSTTKGFLTPRVTESVREAVSNPATGLLIYQIDNAKGFYYNEGTPGTPAWKRIGNNNEEEQISDSRIPIDSVVLFGAISGIKTLYAITESGSYYLTNNIDLTASGLNNAGRRGIVITSDNVTLDLNGYAILGDEALLVGDLGLNDYPIENSTESEGIDVVGIIENLTIKNGFIANWQGDRIDATFTNNCPFKDLHISNVRGKGLLANDHNLIIDCSAYGDGINMVMGLMMAHPANL